MYNKMYREMYRNSMMNINAKELMKDGIAVVNFSDLKFDDGNDDYYCDYKFPCKMNKNLVNKCLREKFIDIVFDGNNTYDHYLKHCGYDIYGDQRSPILVYYIFPNIFFTLDLNADGVLNLNVWENYVCSSFSISSGILDRFKYLEEHSELELSTCIGTEFLNAIYSVFIQSEICVKILEDNRKKLLSEACELFINLCLRYYVILDIDVHLDEDWYADKSIAFDFREYLNYKCGGIEQEKIKFLPYDFCGSEMQVNYNQMIEIPFYDRINDDLLYFLFENENEIRLSLALRCISPIYPIYRVLPISRDITNVIFEVYTDEMKYYFYCGMLCRFLVMLGYCLDNNGDFYRIIRKEESVSDISINEDDLLLISELLKEYLYVN